MGVKTELTCDKCGATLELAGPYHVAKTEMKEKGWRNVQTDDGWQVRCEECRGKK